MNLTAIKWTTLAVCCALLAACAPQTRIVTNKASDFTREPKRIFVLSDIGDEMGKGFGVGFQRKIAALFQRCGIDTESVYLSALELDESIYAKKIEAYRPDSLLAIRRAGGTKDPNGVIVQANFDVRLTDVQSTKVVWRANINTRGGFGMAVTVGEALALELANKLKEDQILRSCPIEVPPGGNPVAAVGAQANSNLTTTPEKISVATLQPQTDNSPARGPAIKQAPMTAVQASTSAPATQPPARPAVAKPAVMGPFKPGKPLPITLDMVRSHTWRYPHPTEFEKNGNIELLFSDSGVQATNKLGGSMGTFELRDGALCLSLVSWTSYCFFVVEEDGQKMAFFTGRGNKVKLTIE